MFVSLCTEYLCSCVAGILRKHTKICVKPDGIPSIEIYHAEAAGHLKRIWWENAMVFLVFFTEGLHWFKTIVCQSSTRSTSEGILRGEMNLKECARKIFNTMKRLIKNI